MTENTLSTVIVLRNDKSTEWADSEVILREGELGVSYLENGNIVVKAGDGENRFADLRQVEGVFEQPVTLTQNFGYYNDVPAGGYKTYANTVGMTTSEFLLSALKKTVEPTITQPSASLSASATVENNDPEIGAKITKITWDGGFSAGSYKIGTATQTTGLSSSNTTWSVSNNKDTQVSTDIVGTFELVSDDYIQIDSELAKTYATVTAEVTLDASNANVPKNNLGEDTAGKITATTAGAPWTKTADVKVTGYRKPFWGVKTESIDVSTITSEQVRALDNSGTATKGLPTSLDVPVGSTQVIFCAKAGIYSSLDAKDANAMNAGVAFTKATNAVDVNGANGYEATAYDMWSVTWADPIVSAKALILTWS